MEYYWRQLISDMRMSARGCANLCSDGTASQSSGRRTRTYVRSHIMRLPRVLEDIEDGQTGQPPEVKEINTSQIHTSKSLQSQEIHLSQTVVLTQVDSSVGATATRAPKNPQPDRAQLHLNIQEGEQGISLLWVWFNHGFLSKALAHSTENRSLQLRPQAHICVE